MKKDYLKEGIISEDLENIYKRDIDWNKFRDSIFLITGSTGMIGSYLVYMLIYLNEIKGLNIKINSIVRSKEKFKKIFGIYANKKYMNVINANLIEKIDINEKIDYIIHAGSIANPRYYKEYPVDVLTPNVIGTYNLLEYAKNSIIKGFIMFSTGSIYGKVSDIEYITEDDLGIVDPLDNHSCYDESKRMAETMCASYFNQYKIPSKILRFSHTYSPTMNIEDDPRVFASFMKNIVYGQDIEIKSDGLEKRTFCYIADAIAALFIILLKGKNGEAYNVCNSEQFKSISELAECLINIRKDVHLNVVYKKRDANDQYLENASKRNIPPSDSKLRKLGWMPQYDIEKGFTRVYKYLSEK